MCLRGGMSKWFAQFKISGSLCVLLEHTDLFEG